MHFGERIKVYIGMTVGDKVSGRTMGISQIFGNDSLIDNTYLVENAFIHPLLGTEKVSFSGVSFSIFSCDEELKKCQSRFVRSYIPLLVTFFLFLIALRRSNTFF